MSSLFPRIVFVVVVVVRVHRIGSSHSGAEEYLGRAV